MQIYYVKTAFMASWVLAIAAVGYFFDTTSLSAWMVLTALSLVPPAIMMQLWRAPVPTMSESIRNVLR
jgi:hypothetical protein